MFSRYQEETPCSHGCRSKNSSDYVPNSASLWKLIACLAAANNGAAGPGSSVYIVFSAKSFCHYSRRQSKPCAPYVGASGDEAFAK